MIKKFRLIFNVITIVASFITPSHGMQPAKQEVGSLAFILTLCNRHTYLDHEDICSCALVNKQTKKLIQDTAKERMIRLRGLITLKDPHSLSVISPLTWHTYGSMCAAKKITNYPGVRYYNAQLCSLVFCNNDIVQTASQLFSYFPDPGEYKSFFDQVKIMQKEVCCYNFDKRQAHLYEHSWSLDGKYCKRDCMMKISNENKTLYALVWLVEFPRLLTAICGAPVKERNETHVIYDLGGAIIPDNYKEARENAYDTHTFEKNVDLVLQNAIIKRYQEQPKKK